MLGDQQVAGARYRQELGDTLDDAEGYGLPEIRHEWLHPSAVTAAMLARRRGVARFLTAVCLTHAKFLMRAISINRRKSRVAAQTAARRLQRPCRFGSGTPCRGD